MVASTTMNLTRSVVRLAPCQPSGPGRLWGGSVGQDAPRRPSGPGPGQLERDSGSVGQGIRPEIFVAALRRSGSVCRGRPSRKREKS